MIRNKKGFTLIELIIVMAIIGILAVVAVIAIGSKSADARDARRLADMATVRTAMALSCSESEDLSMGTVTVGQPAICNTVGSSYLTFTNVQDPSISAACSTSVAGCAETGVTIVCDYAYGERDDGDAFTDGAAAMADLVANDGCDYWINFFQEGTPGTGYASDSGLVE